MVTVRWTPDAGWHDARVRPYGPLSLDPATHIFHYGQSIFEGFKAYRQPDGGDRDVPAGGQRRAVPPLGARLALPELPVEDFVAAADVLIRQDAAWVPRRVRPASTCGRS